MNILYDNLDEGDESKNTQAEETQTDESSSSGEQTRLLQNINQKSKKKNFKTHF